LHSMETSGGESGNVVLRAGKKALGFMHRGIQGFRKTFNTATTPLKEMDSIPLILKYRTRLKKRFGWYRAGMLVVYIFFYTGMVSFFLSVMSSIPLHFTDRSKTFPGIMFGIGMSSVVIIVIIIVQSIIQNINHQDESTDTPEEPEGGIAGSTRRSSSPDNPTVRPIRDDDSNQELRSKLTQFYRRKNPHKKQLKNHIDRLIATKTEKQINQILKKKYLEDLNTVETLGGNIQDQDNARNPLYQRRLAVDSRRAVHSQQYDHRRQLELQELEQLQQHQERMDKVREDWKRGMGTGLTRT